jgi:hypothetical protein
VHSEYSVQALCSADRPTESCLKPCRVIPFVGIHELFTVRHYDTQGACGLQYTKKFTQNGQPEIRVNMFENMLGKYELTFCVTERESLPEIGCEINTREIPSIDIYPAWQYPWPTTKVKFYIIHLHQNALLGSRPWRYTSPEAHCGEMCLYTYILNDAQGYRAGLDDRPCHILCSTTQKRQISSLDMTAVLEFYHIKASTIGRLVQTPFMSGNYAIAGL